MSATEQHHLPVDPTWVGRSYPPRFACEWQRGGTDAIWVHVSGDLDRETAPDLARALRDARVNARTIVLDLRDLQAIDRSGVRTIVDAATQARADRRRQLVVRGPAPVDRVFARLGATDQVDLIDLAPPAVTHA